MTIKVRIGDKVVDYDPTKDAHHRDVIKRLERAEKRRARLDAAAWAAMVEWVASDAPLPGEPT